MDSPVRASDTPFIEDVKEGQVYMWCSCGKSQKQPYCDGSHSGSSFTPLVYKATQTKRLFFCGCKRSLNKPMCDGSHSK